MTSKANKTCKYPELKVGDEVKIYRKKAITEKERTSTWSEQKYTVESITENLTKNITKQVREADCI